MRKSEVNELLQEPFNLALASECTTIPEKHRMGKKRTPLQPRVVQEALYTVNKELASELKQIKAECVQKDRQLEMLK